MGRITAVPFGLQSLLGNTAFGDNPSELAAQTISTLEQFPFLGQTKLDFERDSAPVDSIADGPSIEIPEGEFWIPIQMAAFHSFPEIGISAAIRLDLFNTPRKNPSISPGAHILTGSDIVTSVSIGQQIIVGYQFEHLTLLSNPVEFRAKSMLYNVVPAAPTDIIVYLEYYKLDA